MNFKNSQYFLFLFIKIQLLSAHPSEENFDSQLEASHLKNIQQITYPEMGFEKAGEGYFSPDSKVIIFQAVPTGQEHYQIYVLNLEERIPKRVSTGHGACTCAFFRPDGQKIIFASSHSDPDLFEEDFATNVPGYQRKGGNYVWEFTPYMNIYEANPDGSDLKPLTTGSSYHAECAYSPSGSHIVFANNSEGQMHIYTMKADGTEVNRVTKDRQGYNGGPFFSPDGKQIIFRADYQKKDYLQIYVINSDGTGLKQLTNNRAVNWAPYWHPHGDVFAFTTSLHGHSHYEIYLMNRVTGKTLRLTHHRAFDGLPVFSPDGNKLMWTSKRGPDKTSQIFLADFVMPEEMN